MAKKRVVEMNLTKQGFDVLLNIKVVPEIEAFFKKAAAKNESKQEVSSKWLDEAGNGLPFYTKSAKMASRVAGIEAIDNFGNGLYENGKPNVALLRIIGVSGDNGVTIRTNDLLPYEEVVEYMQVFADWVRDFYQEYLRENIVSSSITIEKSSEDEDDEDEDDDN